MRAIVVAHIGQLGLVACLVCDGSLGLVCLVHKLTRRPFDGLDVAKCAVVLLQDEDTSSSWYSGQDASVECEWIAHLR